jgi:hypothetical protein
LKYLSFFLCTLFFTGIQLVWLETSREIAPYAVIPPSGQLYAAVQLWQSEPALGKSYQLRRRPCLLFSGCQVNRYSSLTVISKSELQKLCRKFNCFCILTLKRDYDNNKKLMPMGFSIEHVFRILF